MPKNNVYVKHVNVCKRERKYLNIEFVYPRGTKSSKELVQKCSCIPGSNGNLGFEERENRNTRRKSSRSRVENQQQIQRREASALTTAPSLLPKNLK